MKSTSASNGQRSKSARREAPPTGASPSPAISVCSVSSVVKPFLLLQPAPQFRPAHLSWPASKKFLSLEAPPDAHHAPRTAARSPQRHPLRTNRPAERRDPHLGRHMGCLAPHRGTA